MGKKAISNTPDAFSLVLLYLSAVTGEGNFSVFCFTHYWCAKTSPKLTPNCAPILSLHTLASICLVLLLQLFSYLHMNWMCERQLVNVVTNRCTHLRFAYGEFFSILSWCTSSRHFNPVRNYQLSDRGFHLKKQTQNPAIWKHSCILQILKLCRRKELREEAAANCVGKSTACRLEHPWLADWSLYILLWSMCALRMSLCLKD